MAETIKGINVVIGSDTTGLSAALSDVNKRSRDIQSELKQVERLLRLDPSNTELVAQRQRLLGDAVANTREKLDRLKSTQEQINEQFARGDITEGQYRAFQREIIATEQELNRLNGQLNTSTTALEELGNTATNVSKKIGDVGEKTKKAGEGLTKGLTVPIAAVGAASIAAFTEVDEGLDTIITKTGASGEAMDKLQESFNNVYGSMPVSAEDAGVAIGEVNTRFRVTGEELESLSKTFLQFANINNTDLNSSIGNTQKIMSQWNIEASKTNEVLGVLTNEAQYSGISIDTLMDSVQKNGAVLKEMGFNLEDSIALLGEFEINGINSEVAMAALRKATVNFSKDGKTTSQGLNETVKSIKAAKTETEALQIATETFGTKGAAEMAKAIRENRLEFDNLGVDMEEFGGVVEGTFEATQDPPDKLKIALNNLNIGLSDLAGTIMEAAAPAIQFVGDKAKELTTWFTGLDDSTKKIIVVIGGLLAALGPLLVIIGTLAGAVSNIVALFGTIATAMGTAGATAGATGAATTGLGATLAGLAGPIAIVIGAITGLILILKKLYDDNEEFRVLVDKAWNAIKETISSAINKVSAFVKDIFGGLLDWWKKNQEAIMQAANVVWGLIQDKIMTVVNFLAPFLKIAWEGIKNTISVVWSAISSVIQIALDLIKGIIMVAVNAINGNWSAVWTTIKDTTISIWSTIKGFISDAINAVKDIIITVIGSLPEKMIEFGKNIIQGLIDGITSMAGAVMEKARAIADSIKNTIQGALGIHSPSRVMMELGQYTGEGLALGIQSTIGEITKASNAMANAVNPSIVNGTASTVSSGSVGGGINQTVNIYSPTALSPAETARQNRRVLQELALQM